MKVNGYKCDMCDTFSADREGWLTVGYIGDQNTDDLVEVCSPQCVGKLGRQLARALDEENGIQPRPSLADESGPIKARVNGNGMAGGATPNTQPCDVCGQKFGTRQGLSTHRRKAHNIEGGLGNYGEVSVREGNA